MPAATKPLIDNLVGKVRELASARPDNVYRAGPSGQSSPPTKCTYLGGTCTDGTVGCLVGQALLAIGYTAEQLQPVDQLGIEEAIEKMLPCELTDDEYDKVRWLESAQNAQDNGSPWKEAVRIADAEQPL
jgi:hypothetical protein